MNPASGLVFLDASVLVAASRSPSGGSAVCLEVCQGTAYRAALSTAVLLEARRNVAEKFGETELLRLYRQLAGLDPVMVPPPSQELLERCVPLTTEKDAHVLAAALACQAKCLLTLNKQHLLTDLVQSANLSVQMLTPGDFLNEVVRKHDQPA